MDKKKQCDHDFQLLNKYKETGKAQDAADFMFELRPDGSYVMSEFTRNGAPLSGSLQGKVGKVVKTPLGNIEVQKVDNNAPMELTVRL